MSARTYGQFCGLARALDVLGERWTLLLIRELSRGPKRFRDLLTNLPGIGTNLLTARLKSLETDGVIRRTLLPPPAGVQVYELTPRGRALEQPLEQLALWGFELLLDDPSTTTARAAWAAASMRAAATAEALAGVQGSFAFVVGDERFHVTVTDGEARLEDGVPAGEPEVRAAMDLPTFFALASRQLDVATAVRRGELEIAGDPERLERLFAGFHLPERTGDGAHARTP